MEEKNAPRQQARFVNGKRVHFGKKETPKGRQMVKLEDFLQRRRLPAPAPSEWGKNVRDWMMLNNSAYGDCVEAEKWHFLMAAMDALGKPLTPDERTVVENYFDQTGGPDNGLVMGDSYDWWERSPDKYGGEKLLAWASVDFRNWTTVMQASQWFGGVAWGVNLPDNCFDEINAGKPWSDTHQSPDPYMGHAIYGYKCDQDGGACITWGQKQGFTKAWIEKYATDCYVRITDAWIRANPIPGVDTAALVQAYKDLTGKDPGPIVPPGPGPGPGPGNILGKLTFPSVTIPGFDVQVSMAQNARMGGFKLEGWSIQDLLDLLMMILSFVQQFQTRSQREAQRREG